MMSIQSLLNDEPILVMSGVETSLTKSWNSLEPQTTISPLYVDELPTVQDEPITVEMGPESPSSNMHLATMPTMHPVHTSSKPPLLDSDSRATSPSSATSSAPSDELIRLLSDLEPSSNENTPSPQPSQRLALTSPISNNVSIMSSLFNIKSNLTQSLPFDEPINVENEPFSTPDSPCPRNSHHRSCNSIPSRIQFPLSNSRGNLPIDVSQALPIDGPINVRTEEELSSPDQRPWLSRLASYVPFQITRSNSDTATEAERAILPITPPPTVSKKRGRPKGSQSKKTGGKGGQSVSFSVAIVTPSPTTMKRPADSTIESQRKRKVTVVKDTASEETVQGPEISPSDRETEDDEIPSEPVKSDIPKESQESTKVRAINVPYQKPFDSRYDSSAIILKDGVHMVPNRCYKCASSKTFCDRGNPCKPCSETGRECLRKEGLCKASPRRTRGPNDDQTNPKSGLQYPVVSDPTVNLLELQSQVQQELRTYTAAGDTQFVITDLVIPAKPSPRGNPLVWADHRQALCEGLSYFRQYQGGIQYKNNIVYGLLVDGFGSDRDFIGSHVVITHGGGKSKKDPLTKTRFLSKSQRANDKGISALLSNLRNETPFVMIIGKKCRAAPSAIPHRYCVMDWFRVTHAWCEKDGTTEKVRWKFRFEKLGEEAGWWTPANDPPSPVQSIPSQVCTQCNRESPMVYKQGWMCLSDGCPSFWKIDNEPPRELEYLPSFLGPTPVPSSISLRTPCHDLRPPMVADKDLNYNGKDVSEIFWRGIHCPTCNCLNSRVYFSHWECFNCGRKFGSQNPTIYTAMELADPERPIYTGLPVITDWVCPDSGVTMTLSVLEVEGGLIRCARYDFEKGGRIYHLSPSVGAMGGADEMFRKYQTQGIPFKRYRMSGGKVDGGMLGQHFLHNVGEPYKFCVRTSSQSFEEAAPVISEAKELLTKRVNLLLCCEFNEILSVTYMEGQHMKYHDDGEELKIIASLSLGSPAEIRVRPKPIEASDRRGISYSEGNDQSEDGDEDTEETQTFGPVEPSMPCSSSRTQSHTRDILRMQTHHGDIIIQEGSALQRHYQHAAIPKGMRIVATARYIESKTRQQGVQAQETPSYSQVRQRFTTPQPSSEITEITGIPLTGLPTPPEETSEAHLMNQLKVQELDDTRPEKTCRVPTMYRREQGRGMSAPLSGLPPYINNITSAKVYLDVEDGTIHDRVRATTEAPPTIVSSGIVGEGNEWMNRPTYTAWR